jgi:transcriptional regulator with XRE-family HTH domain
MAREQSLTIKNRLGKLLGELADPSYRRAYVEGNAKDTVAFQLRRMRISREWEQKDVAARLGNSKLQPMISRYENPDYGKYSVTTLLDLANAFDVALVVRFVKFSELVRWDLHKNEATLQPKSFRDDTELVCMVTETWMWRREDRTSVAAYVPPVSGYNVTALRQLSGVSSSMTPVISGNTQGRAA